MGTERACFDSRKSNIETTIFTLSARSAYLFELKSLLVPIFAPEISILEASWHPFWLPFGSFFVSFSLYVFSIAFSLICFLFLRWVAAPRGGLGSPNPPHIVPNSIKKRIKNQCKFYYYFGCDFYWKSDPTGCILAPFLETFWHQNRSCKRNLDFWKNVLRCRREH